MRNLVYGVLERRGCLVLTSEPGLGKTTVLRALCGYLSESNAQCSIITTPVLTSSEFLELLMLNFGMQEIPVSKARRLRMLEEYLIRFNDADTVSALIVDEAHTIGDEVLEEIRLLGNLEAGNRQLLQIVLAGQSELNGRLNLPSWFQFKQRIATRLTLSRLDRDHVGEYIRFRWSAAGAGPLPFTESALHAIAASSLGIPRVVNVLCHNALRIAFAEKSHTVGPGNVRQACTELDLPAPELPCPAPAIPSPRPSVHQPEPPEAKGWWSGMWRSRKRQEEGSARIRSTTSILSLEDPSQ